MTRTNLRNAVDLIATRQPFIAGANTLRGEWDGNTYRVYSYRALIATITLDGKAWITDQKWSVTTSRHTSVARRGVERYLQRELIG
jgi:hypothetical protein